MRLAEGNKEHLVIFHNMNGAFWCTHPNSKSHRAPKNQERMIGIEQ